ncbi:hypothetical protein BpHYR1_009002 [Brachionus plicatilis]|uniref:Uncharacterized protein n=1 Tax=Brachionus plicatilis TaxID=10195 RepID=A0A3M7QE62_BRAPC|nr:hypothetical protein BpHYR1_009002 [Brachionus plicatilis]
MNNSEKNYQLIEINYVYNGLFLLKNIIPFSASIYSTKLKKNLYNSLLTGIKISKKKLKLNVKLVSNNLVKHIFLTNIVTNAHSLVHTICKISALKMQLGPIKVTFFKSKTYN